MQKLIFSPIDIHRSLMSDDRFQQSASRLQMFARAQEPTPEEPEPEAATEAPLISTELAIIIAVVVVAIIAAVAYLVIRKRK